MARFDVYANTGGHAGRAEGQVFHLLIAFLDAFVSQNVVAHDQPALTC